MVQPLFVGDPSSDRPVVPAKHVVYKGDPPQSALRYELKRCGNLMLERATVSHAASCVQRHWIHSVVNARLKTPGNAEFAVNCPMASRADVRDWKLHRSGSSRHATRLKVSEEKQNRDRIDRISEVLEPADVVSLGDHKGHHL